MYQTFPANLLHLYLMCQRFLVHQVVPLRHRVHWFHLFLVHRLLLKYQKFRLLLRYPRYHFLQNYLKYQKYQKFRLLQKYQKYHYHLRNPMYQKRLVIPSHHHDQKNLSYQMNHYFLHYLNYRLYP
jgi:hypothetical protein